MSNLLKAIGLVSALVVAPAMAEPVAADAHAVHHPAAAEAAKTDRAAADGKGCPMMKGARSAEDEHAGKPDGHGAADMPMAGGMVMKGKPMHCMAAKPDAKTAPPDQAPK